jgi:hypothetical protein
VLVLLGSWPLMPRFGIDGVGVAWLGANILVAAARLPAIVRVAWPRPAPEASPGSRSQRPRHAGAHRRSRASREPRRDAKPSAAASPSRAVGNLAAAGAVPGGLWTVVASGSALPGSAASGLAPESGRLPYPDRSQL